MLQAIPPAAQVAPQGVETSSHEGVAAVAGAVAAEEAAAEAIASSPVPQPGKGARAEDRERPEDRRRQPRRREPPAGEEEPHLLDLFA